MIGHLVPTVLALACIAGVVYIGHKTGWTLPKFSALRGDAAPEKDDWCDEHGVPDSICVECKKECMPRGKEYGWCRKHGVHECPLCNPEVAHTSLPAVATGEDRERAERTLAFAPRVENNSKCKLHQRRIQFNSEDVLNRLGIDVKPVTQAPVAEFVTAPGEIVYDPTRVARLSARVPGTVWRVTKQVGDRVKAGEVLALIDAAAVGKAKAEFQQALVEEELRTKTLANLKESEGVVPGKTVQEAEAALQEAQVRLLTAEQALANLGLPIDAADVRKLAPAELARRMQFLGLPETLAKSLAGETASSNLIAVAAPLEGEVVARTAVAGEAAEPTKALFTVADTRRMRLNLRVRLEDAGKIAIGQTVRFRHEGHTDGDAGTVAWVSPSADEKTRTVPVRVDLPNASGRHHANTFGTAQVVLREESKAVVVPSDAVHWEGDCNVVFVQDKDFAKQG
ncbi:MAG TPA: efflux RND transporter periplasmic adaptor subunit, partial [Gemmataceae bacterium]|nr:efflux RND transporter periplasmic adaptor subunit [Gemmataceae bacterium]